MTVKVKNISGLENYATSIQGFAGKFELAANDTVREFNTSLEGEKAEAINAFFKKLNDIQNTVFSEAPGFIRTFGQHISEFTDNIKGVGFSNLAYTDSSAMNTLLESLSTPQRNEITLVKDDLVTLLDEAIEAMGEGDSSLGNFDTQADTFILDEISARKVTHNIIILANMVLSLNSMSSLQIFKSLTESTRKARVIVQNIEPADVLKLIASDKITTKNINYLELISTESDAKIANAAWNDQLEDTTLLPPETIKDGYKIISMELSIGIEENKKKKIERYFDSLGKAPVEISKEHIKNLKSANDFQAYQLQAAQAGLNELEYDEDSPEMIELKSRLRALSKLNGLLLSAEKLDLGTSESTSYSNMTQYHNRVSYDLEITKLDGDDNITFTVTKRQTLAAPEVKYYTSGLATNYSESQVSKDLNMLYKNQQEQSKEGIKFLGNLASLATDFIPGGKATKVAVSSFKTLLSTMDSFDFKEMGSGISETVPETITIGGKKVPLKTFVKGAGDFIDSANKLNKNLSNLSKDEIELRDSLVRGITNKGAWSLSQNNVPKIDFWKGVIPTNNSDELEVDATYYYDYDAYLREKYLDKKGVSEYLDTNTLNKYIEQVNADKEIKNYLRGDSSLEISKMNSDQIKQLSEALKNLPGKSGSENFKTDFLWNNSYMEKK